MVIPTGIRQPLKYFAAVGLVIVKDLDWVEALVKAVPTTPAAGRPVQEVRVPDAGVPNAGVNSEGESKVDIGI